MLAARHFQLLLSAATGTSQVATSGHCALLTLRDPTPRRGMVINTLPYNTLWDLQFYKPAKLLPFHCLGIKAQLVYGEE